MEEKLQDIEDVFQKYIQAGNILSQVRSEAVKRIKIGASLLDVAEFVEKRTVELGGLPAFPCNISRNEEAAHATPSKNDSSVFEQDMVKLDMGVHVDGYIADSALTVDFTSNQDIVKAS
ncbi:methionine aminopeptidase [Methanosalsum natronophilum]|nr:methionine aminopeptidase [Methanosalsum natronophilum]